MQTEYENSIFYIIHSCSKCFDKLFEQFFKQLNIAITPIELLSLKVISDKPECSQRDLAKIILKDRASAGKIAQSLEKKGMVKITLKMKNNRPSKTLTITSKGKKINEQAMYAAHPYFEKILKLITQETLDNTIATLKNFKKTVEDVVRFNI